MLKNALFKPKLTIKNGASLASKSLKKLANNCKYLAEIGACAFKLAMKISTKRDTKEAKVIRKSEGKNSIDIKARARKARA